MLLGLAPQQNGEIHIMYDDYLVAAESSFLLTNVTSWSVREAAARSKQLLFRLHLIVQTVSWLREHRARLCCRTAIAGNMQLNARVVETKASAWHYSGLHICSRSWPYQSSEQRARCGKAHIQSSACETHVCESSSGYNSSIRRVAIRSWRMDGICIECNQC